ncbi:MAG: hypothetical protein JXQ67_06985 [Campylobacterales bacterium]|nr:hypothetical protein [Campylobacterales bacterium]
MTLLWLKAEPTVLSTPADIAKEAHLANINALLIFTSQDGLNTGLFHFTKVNVDMQIYNLPFIYHFDSHGDYNYFIVGNVGYSRVFTSQDYVIPPGTRLTADSHLQTYTAGVGVGVRYHLKEELKLLSGVEFIYSRSGVNVVKKDGTIIDPIEDFFNNSYNDNISYKLFFEAEYEPNMPYIEPYFKLGYKFYDTKSDFSFEKLTNFSTQSNVFWASMGLESRKLYETKEGYITIEGYLGANYLEGDVVKSVGFDNYIKLGGVGYFYLEDEESWIERFFLETNTIKAVGLEAYNIGVGFTINY